MSSNYPPGSDTPNAPWNHTPRRVVVTCECGWTWKGNEDDTPPECDDCTHAFNDNEYQEYNDEQEDS